MTTEGPTPEAWTHEDTERWLTDWPLPPDFEFRQEKVWPRYALKKGYGFWLRTAGPYHVALRGLFNLCHEILSGVPVGQAMPTSEELAEKIRERELSHAQLTLSAEDLAPRDPPGLAAAEHIRESIQETDEEPL